VPSSPYPGTIPRAPATSIPLAAVGLGLLALLGTAGIVGYPFVQDDSGVIVGNALIREWSGLWRAFGAPYWPPLNSGELYRPISTAGFTAQWILGGGTPLLFRITSLLLYVASVLAVWRLLRTLVPAGAAWLGAALFAVHPVHVEAVAVAVNQSELIVALLLITAVVVRIRVQRDQLSVRSGGILLWVLFVLGIFTKEHALVLPGLLFAVDLFIDAGREPLRKRLRRWRWHYALLVVTAVIFWTIRTRVLGPGAGTQVAEALLDSSMAQRAWTMVGVPAEWLRLFLWPAHLQVDWNLNEWVATRGWTSRESSGVFALLAFAAALAASWRRRLITAFGLVWMALALAPVSNLLLPTGIILAERTLFLPSVGLVIVAADLIGALQTRWSPPSALLGRLGLLAAGSVLGLGLVRSAIRVLDWRARPVFLAVQTIDAPTSWRARIAYGLFLAEAGDTVRARIELHRAVALRPDKPLVAKPLVDRMRLGKGECVGPAMVYQELLARSPRRSDARGALVACQLWLGRYAEARAEATRGVDLGLDREYFTYVIGVADSASAAGASPATVRLRLIGGNATLIGPLTELPR
jgi:protein O-mannosyl-transferase